MFDSHCFGVAPKGGTHWQNGCHYKKHATRDLWLRWNATDKEWQNERGAVISEKRETYDAIRQADEAAKKAALTRTASSAARTSTHPERVAKAFKLKGEGMKLKEIARLVEVSEWTVTRYFRLNQGEAHG